MKSLHRKGGRTQSSGLRKALIPLLLILFSTIATSCNLIMPVDEKDPQYFTYPYKSFQGTDKQGNHKEGALFMDIFALGSGLEENINEKNVRDWTDELFAGTLSIATPPRIPIIIVHGGAWNMGSTLSPIYKNWWTLIKHNRFRVFIIEYRLSGCEQTGEQLTTTDKICWQHPAAVDDVRDAVAFVKANSKVLGVDPSRLILVGDSAGAHLSLLHAIRSSRPDRKDLIACPITNRLTTVIGNPGCDTSVAGVASFYAPADFDSLLSVKTNPFTLQSIADYIGTDTNTIQRIADGDTSVDPEILARYEDADVFRNLHPGMPPIFFSHSSGDQVVPFTTILRVEEKIRQLTEVEAFWMKDLSDNGDIQFLDISSWEVGLPHNYMYAMAALGKSYYQMEEAGRHDLRMYSDKSEWEKEILIWSDPVAALYDLDLSLRNWILRIDRRLD